MKVLGIDPGLNGALVFRNGESVTSYRMPLIGKSVDVKAIYNICNVEKPDFAIVEKQFILKWQKGNMTTIGNYHRILAALEFSDVKYKIITARSWLKKLGLDGDKGEHVNKAIELGFDVPRKSNRGNSPYHDGMADAYLIAYSHSSN